MKHLKKRQHREKLMMTTKSKKKKSHRNQTHTTKTDPRLSVASFLCHSANYVSDLDLFRFFFPVSMVRVLEFFWMDGNKLSEGHQTLVVAALIVCRHLCVLLMSLLCALWICVYALYILYLFHNNTHMKNVWQLFLRSHNLKHQRRARSFFGCFASVSGK